MFSITRYGGCDSSAPRIFCRFGVVAKNWTLTRRCGGTGPPPAAAGTGWSSSARHCPRWPRARAPESSAPARLGAVFLRKKRRPSFARITRAPCGIRAPARRRADSVPADRSENRSRRRSACAGAGSGSSSNASDDQRPQARAARARARAAARREAGRSRRSFTGCAGLSHGARAGAGALLRRTAAGRISRSAGRSTARRRRAEAVPDVRPVRSPAAAAAPAAGLPPMAALTTAAGWRPLFRARRRVAAGVAVRRRGRRGGVGSRRPVARRAAARRPRRRRRRGRRRRDRDLHRRRQRRRAMRAEIEDLARARAGSSSSASAAPRRRTRSNPRAATRAGRRSRSRLSASSRGAAPCPWSRSSPRIA